MIVVAGLTPAWQQILRFERFQPGEVNRADEALWCASGKVLNVGAALVQLGAECLTISPAGGAPAAAMRDELAALGARVDWIETAAATRVCTTILDAATGQTTELVENARPLSAAELNAFAQAFAAEADTADLVVLAGSLPAAAPSSFYRDLLERTHTRAIIDARGPELLEALKCRPFVVKPNREELARTVGRELSSDTEVAAAAKELVERGATWVVVTHGREAVWAVSASSVYRLLPPSAERVVNPIGSGDSLAAGLAWAIDQGKEFVDAVQLGIAAAVDNVGQLLPARISPGRVRQIAARVPVDRVSA